MPSLERVVGVGYERLSRNYTLMTDAYVHTMFNGYFLQGMEDKVVVFDLVFKKVPNDGGYAIMAALYKVIPYIENLKFDERVLNFFRKNGYSEDFIEY